jgi:hypothetical protein
MDVEGKIQMLALRKVDALTRKWWFLGIMLLLFFIPSYSARPVDPRETSKLITAVLSAPLIGTVPALLPISKVLPLLLVLALALWGDKVTRLFNAYVAVTILLFALFQNAALTSEFGLAVLLGNAVVYLLVASTWFWEVAIKANDLAPRPRSLWRYGVIPVAFLAFWFPVDRVTLGPDFSLAQLFTNSAGLATCMMLPVYLAVLTLYYPSINWVALRITAWAGMITGLLNMLQWFVLAPQPWIGVLHLPLLTISVYALVLSLRGNPTMPAEG